MSMPRAGNIPHKRHTQHRAPDGSLYAEELFGVEGFTGRSHSSTTSSRRRGRTRSRRPARDPPRGGRRRLPPPSADRPAGVERRGDAVTGRIPLFFNSDIVIGVVRPAERCPRRSSTATARPTRCCTSTRARASSTPSSGRSVTAPATTSSFRSARPGGSHPTRAASSGCSTSSARPRSSRPSAIATTTASSSSIRLLAARHPAAEDVPARTDEGDFQVHVKMRDRLTAYHYRHHPFDVVGWDGYLWPYAFNIGDFEPITGRVHQPPPVHQTFAARNFVVCSFVPRKFDYHPLAIPAPYNHSNINRTRSSTRRRQLHSRRGVGISSFTLHPAGIPTAAAGNGRSLDRQGGDRGAGGDGRHVPPAQDHRRPRGSRMRATHIVAASRGRLRRGPRAARTRAGGVPD